MVTKSLDDSEKTIILNLLVNARTRYNKIADQCQLSVSRVIQKHKQMQEDGIITGSTLIQDPRKDGKNIIASFNIDVTRIGSLMKIFEKMEEILFYTHTMGRYDIYAIAACENLEKMNTLVIEIKNLAIVKNFVTNIWAGQYIMLPENIEL